MVARHMATTAVVLGLFAVAGTGLVAVTHGLTEGPIAEAERRSRLETLHALIPPSAHDNALDQDMIEVRDPRLGTSEPVTVYRARKGGQPVAVLINSIAPDGYSGEIKLLVAVGYDGTLVGVRVVSHRETPGLGDDIEEARSDWIHSFDGRALGNPPPDDWAVKKDDGIFDQFTGATITPRAVVKAVRNTLEFYADNRDRLFAPSTATEAKPDDQP